VPSGRNCIREASADLGRVEQAQVVG